SPVGVLIAPDTTVYVTEAYYHLIRKVTGTGLAAPLPWPPPAPTNLMATAISGQVSLSWSPSTGASSYNVKRSPGSGGPYSIITSNITTTTYTDTAIINGATY